MEKGEFSLIALVGTSFVSVGTANAEVPLTFNTNATAMLVRQIFIFYQRITFPIAAVDSTPGMRER